MRKGELPSWALRFSLWLRPCVLAGLIPWSITRWEFRPAFFGLELTRASRRAPDLAGVPGLVDSFARFALQGLGTPAPVAPTKNLWSQVSTGMCAIRSTSRSSPSSLVKRCCSAIGASLLGALLWLAFHVFVVAYEEPTLAADVWRESTRHIAPTSRAGFRGWPHGESRNASIMTTGTAFAKVQARLSSLIRCSSCGGAMHGY